MLRCNDIGIVVDQIQLCSEFDLGHHQIGISISDIPNWNFRFGISMSEMWPYPKSNLGYPESDLEHIRPCPKSTWVNLGQVWFERLNTPNSTMSQICLGKFGSWSGLVSYVRNLTMSQIYLDIFGTWSCSKFTQADLGHGRIWYHIFQTHLCPKFT